MPQLVKESVLLLNLTIYCSSREKAVKREYIVFTYTSRQNYTEMGKYHVKSGIWSHPWHKLTPTDGKVQKSIATLP